MVDVYTQRILDAFTKGEKQKQEHVRRYLVDRRANYVPGHPHTIQALSRAGQLDWAAANSRCRVDAAEILASELPAFRKQHRTRSPLVHSVLVAPLKWCRPIGVAHEVEIEAIRAELESLLAGRNYFGAIEPGLYPRRTPSGEFQKGVVSWHAHAVVWNDREHSTIAAVQSINAQNEGPLFGVAPANYRRRSWETIAKPLLYALKTPGKSYATRRIPESINRQTGEIIPEHDQQQAQRLRPGELVKMLNVLREFTLDELLVVGGNGYDLVAPLRDRISRDRERLRSGYARLNLTDPLLRGALA